MSGSTGGHTPPSAGVAHAAGGGSGAAQWMLPSPPADSPVLSRAPATVPLPHHQADGLAGDWPLRDFLELGALAGAVPCARYHTRHILREWGLSRLGDNAELLVAELMTNAVSASRSMDWPAPVRLWLLSDTASVLILVWDASPRPPVRIDPAGDAETGRGLLLVESISTRWDWYPVPGTGGKIAWALLTA